MTIGTGLASSSIEVVPRRRALFPVVAALGALISLAMAVEGLLLVRGCPVLLSRLEPEYAHSTLRGFNGTCMAILGVMSLLMTVAAVTVRLRHGWVEYDASSMKLKLHCRRGLLREILVPGDVVRVRAATRCERLTRGWDFVVDGRCGPIGFGMKDKNADALSSILLPGCG